jgi:nucleoredoxin
MRTTASLALLLAVTLLAPATLSAAIETWTNLDGVEMKAEYLGRKGDYVTFKKPDGSRYLYPYSKLREKDRERIDALALTAPSNGSLTVAGETPSSSSSGGATAPAGKIPAALGGNLVAVKGSSLQPIPREQTNGAKFVAFYYSAKWCPPCRAFTPELVKAYAKIKAKHPEFELVFVSSDQDAAAMADYMKSYKMTFPGVLFDVREKLPVLTRPDHERGIPNLVFMTADGKELSVSYDKSGRYLGPRKVLADIEKHFGI